MAYFRPFEGMFVIPELLTEATLHSRTMWPSLSATRTMQTRNLRSW